MNSQSSATVCEPANVHPLNQLENRVQVWLSGRVRQLRILQHGHGIVLRGFARTYHAKQLAQHAVMRETPMPILANEIEVG
ncbi:MAG TPA: hypothetical protein VFE62_15440 [Gemmataceae bacterium]|nr:hypothetical protein [Gemmataceae bacterium]